MVYWRLGIVWGHSHPGQSLPIVGGGWLECSAKTEETSGQKQSKLYMKSLSSCFLFKTDLVLNPDSVILSNFLNFSNFSFSTVKKASDS